MDLVVEPVGPKVPLKALLRLLRQDALLERPRDLADERVARNLDAEGHLPEELELRLREPGREYPQESAQQLSRPERGYAVISHVVSF